MRETYQRIHPQHRESRVRYPHARNIPTPNQPPSPDLRTTTLTHVIPTPTHAILPPTNVIPILTPAIPALTPVIPAKAGIHPAASNSRRTAPIPPSTKSDKNRQNPTESNRNSCVRARAREASPRHSREGGNLPARVPFPFSRHGLFLDRSGSTYRLELPSHKPHTNKSSGTAPSNG